MKKLRAITIMAILSLIITFGFSSCLVHTHKDNGYHRGWYKNKNHHRNNNVYIIKQDNHKQPKDKQIQKGRSKKKNK